MDISLSTDTKEVWKTINGFENYIVSNLGRVKNKKFNQTLKQCIGSNGYYQLQLYQNKKPLNLTVHRLVALTFCPNPQNKLYVDHIDGNKLHNCAENLRWSTKNENGSNSKKRKNTISCFKGVSPYKNKWMSRVVHKGDVYYLGIFTSEEEAGKEYDKTASLLFGEYAKLNFS